MMTPSATNHTQERNTNAGPEPPTVRAPANALANTMGLLISKALDALSFATETRVLMLGLDAAGKTTMLYVSVICASVHPQKSGASIHPLASTRMLYALLLTH